MLAKTEMDIALNMLLDRFPDMALAEGHVPTEVGIFTRAPAELRVSLRAS